MPLKSLYLFLFVLLLSVPIYSQLGITTHTINVNVQTDQIDANNMGQTVNFGQAAGITNEDFTITVKRGDKIVWTGIPSDPNDKVKVKAIANQSSKSFFNKNSIGDKLYDQGVVRGTIKSGEEGEEMKYSIKFKVMNGNKKRGIYIIDPKIRITN